MAARGDGGDGGGGGVDRGGGGGGFRILVAVVPRCFESSLLFVEGF